MESNDKLKRLHIRMLAIGITASLLACGTAIVWICAGVWWPFIIGMAACIALCCWLCAVYYRDTGYTYVCPNCGHTFRPPFKTVFFALHTLRKRRLVCPECGVKDWCLETAAE